MVRDRRRDRAPRHTDPPLTAQEQAVRDAEAIVCLAWAEELLRQNDRIAIVIDTARQECQAASDRLVAAQHCGDPRQISLAHAMLEDALEVHRASEAASAQVRRALETALSALARTKKEYVSAARQVQDGLVAAKASTATTDRSRRRVPSSGGGLEVAGRVLVWVGRLLAHRVSDPGQP